MKVLPLRPYLHNLGVMQSIVYSDKQIDTLTTTLIASFPKENKIGLNNVELYKIIK